MTTPSFKEKHSLEERMLESTRIRDKYPDRVPVIVEVAKRTNLSPPDKYKYLVPLDLSVSQFTHVLRKRMDVTSEKAIFIFVGKVLPLSSALMSTIYNENKENDGFLYMTVAGENTFG